MEVSPGYEEVVEEFLKQELECVVVEQYAQARSGIALLQTQGTGRSTFFVTHLPSSGHAARRQRFAGSREPGVVAAIRELVRFEPKLGLNGDLVLPAISSAYVVEDDAAAERLAGAYPDCHFLTATGAHYHHRMVSGGKGSSAGPLALRRDFRELERRTAELEAKIRASETALAEAAELAKRLDEQLKSLASSKMEAEKKAVVADEKLRQTRETCDRTRKQLGRPALRSGGIAERTRARRGAPDALRAGTRDRRRRQGPARSRPSTRPRSRHANIAPNLTGWRRKSPTPNPPRGHWKSERARRRLKPPGCWQPPRIFTTALPGWPNKTRFGSRNANAWAGKRIPPASPATIAIGTGSGASCAARVWKRKPAPFAPNAIPWAPAWTRRARSLKPGGKSAREAEVARARAESDFAHHAQQCRDELNTDAAALLAEIVPESVLAGEALQAAEEELRQLKARIESLGPVNMMALEELAGGGGALDLPRYPAPGSALFH